MSPTKAQQRFAAADLALVDRVRLALPIARHIAAEGLGAYGGSPDGGPDLGEAVLHWLGDLAGDQEDQLADDNMNVHCDWLTLQNLAAMTYALGLAVGLHLRAEAFAKGGGR